MAAGSMVNRISAATRYPTFEAGDLRMQPCVVQQFHLPAIDEGQQLFVNV